MAVCGDTSGNVGPAHFYSYTTLQDNEPIHIDSCNSWGDSDLTVYLGGCGASSVCVDYNDVFIASLCDFNGAIFL